MEEQQFREIEVKDLETLSLDRLLQEKGLTAKEFANRLGVDENTVYRWKTKRNAITAENLLKACPVLGVSAKLFLAALGYDVEDLPDDEPPTVIKRYKIKN
jgi:transcriptional regulator with XRE-family HTH domain